MYVSYSQEFDTDTWVLHNNSEFVSFFTLMKAFRIFIIILLAMTCALGTSAKRHMNDKVLNKPYADLRPWHLGFSVGTQTLNLAFTHNGFVTDEGETWMAEQPDYSPGFCVNGLVDFRLGNNFNLRFTPGMYFGNRDVKFIEVNSGQIERQNLKSTFLVFPFDLKFAGNRYGNSRPYVVGGVMPAFDLAKKQNDFLKLRSPDVYLSVGFGCDFYLPYFKFIPEVKFCFGLNDMIEHDRPDLQDDPNKFKITQSITKATSKMIVLTFYFE